MEVKNNGKKIAAIIAIVILILGAAGTLIFLDPAGLRKSGSSESESSSKVLDEDDEDDSEDENSSDSSSDDESSSSSSSKDSSSSSSSKKSSSSSKDSSGSSKDSSSSSSSSSDDKKPADSGRNSVLTLDSGDDFDMFVNETYKLMISGLSNLDVHLLVKDPEAAGLKVNYKFGDKIEDSELLNTFDDDFMKFVEDGLKKFDPDKLSDTQRVTYKLLSYETKMYNITKDQEPYIASFFSQNGNYLSGIQSTFAEFPIEDEEDVELYIECLEGLPGHLKNSEKEIDRLIKEENLLFTEGMYDSALDYGKDWLADDAKEEVLYVAFKNNIEKTDIPKDKQKEYLEKVAEIIENSIMPAIERYLKFVKRFKDDIDTASGLANFDGGKEYYNTLMEVYIGAGVDCDVLYEYVERRLYEYKDRLIEMLREDSDLFMKYSDAESKYGDDPNEILKTLAKLTKEKFVDIGDIDWIVSYLAKEQENDVVAAYYMSPQLDNIDRKVIRVNESKVSDTVDLFITLAHEGIPGHLYQDEYLFQRGNYPEMYQCLTYLGVQEGWSMFMEKQAYFWCLDDKDVAELYYRESMLDYIMQALADIRVNYYGDDVSELRSYLNDTMNMGLYARPLLELVVSDPCLFPAYGIGFLLMEDTFDALIEKGYSEEEAYKKILDVGNAPFTILWEELGIENPILK